MANITAQMVKELRDKTGAGMMDCKAALAETQGDLEGAVDWLRKKGLAKAAKKAGRVAAEGLIGIVLVKVNVQAWLRIFLSHTLRVFGAAEECPVTEYQRGIRVLHVQFRPQIHVVGVRLLHVGILIGKNVAVFVFPSSG